MNACWRRAMIHRCGYLLLDQVWMEYVISDCVKNDLYIHSLHSVTACVCADVEVPILVKKMAAP